MEFIQILNDYLNGSLIINSDTSTIVRTIELINNMPLAINNELLKINPINMDFINTNCFIEMPNGEEISTIRELILNINDKKQKWFLLSYDEKIQILNQIIHIKNIELYTDININFLLENLDSVEKIYIKQLLILSTDETNNESFIKILNFLINKKLNV